MNLLFHFQFFSLKVLAHLEAILTLAKTVTFLVDSITRNNSWFSLIK